MQFRTLFLVAVCASIGSIPAALAGPSPIAPPVQAATGVVQIAVSKAEADKLKKKKLLAEAKAKAAAETKAKAKLAAKAKAAEDKKRAAVAEAKSAEKAKLLAKKKAAEEIRLAAKAKAAEERKLAMAEAAEKRKLAKAKAAEERKLAKAKLAEERKLAALSKAKAAVQRKLAKVQAAEQLRLAKAQAAEDARQAELSRLASMEVAQTGNNGELRSERPGETKKPVGLFAGLFGGGIVQQQSMLPETRALDAVLEQKQAGKKFQVKSEFEPQTVSFSGYPRDTIVVDTASRYLYLVESSSSARRYAIAVGREGLEFKGAAKVGDKQEWPRWIPTLDMQKREPKKYGQYKDGMPGGAENPLGARAIYLYQGNKDTHIRIHGTNQPQTIGTNSSNGCFRMVNDHVMDLYGRVTIGTTVVVM